MRIKEFQGEYRWLSNFWETSVIYEGQMFPSAEAAFQAAKIIVLPRDINFYLAENNVSKSSMSTKELEELTLNLTHKKREAFTIMSAPVAKQEGKVCSIRSDWKDVRMEIMKTILRSKFELNLDLMEKLLATEGIELIEGNTWGDKFWGVDNGKGKNNLGKLLMEIRDEFLQVKNHE